MTDVVVVGGGVVGLVSAWRLAQEGLSVEVFDPEPGQAASSVAAGMLAPVTEARPGEEELLALGLASLARWPGFAAELEDAAGETIGYRSDGTVVVARDADDRAALVDLVDRQRSMGLAVEDLSGGELRELEPALAPSVRRGALAASERSVDPRALVRALLAVVQRAGVAVTRQKVVGLVLTDEGGEVGGVTLDDGRRVAAGGVVLAAGPWSGELEGLPPAARPPVRPVKGQILTLRQRPDDLLVQHTVRGYVRGTPIYLVPRADGRVVCGATVEERGWDARVTAGGAYELLRDVLALYPGLDDAELVDVQARFRPAAPDDRPLLGPSEVEGLIVATGHHRNGILLTPFTGEAVAALVTGAEPPAEVAACDPRRFTAGVVR